MITKTAQSQVVADFAHRCACRKADEAQTLIGQVLDAHLPHRCACRKADEAQTVERL